MHFLQYLFPNFSRQDEQTYPQYKEFIFAKKSTDVSILERAVGANFNY